MHHTNQEISKKLREHATKLARHGDNLYRVRAFRQAAMVVLALPQELTDLVELGGVRALERVPGVGKGLAATITDYLKTLNSTGFNAA